MNLTKIGVLLKNALGFGSKAIFIDLGKYFKTDRVQGFQREDQETVPQQSLPQITTPGNMEESPVVTAITRLIELKWPSWRTCQRYHHASRLVFLET